MSRTVAVVAALLALVAVLLAWRWWSAPAETTETELAMALTVAPAAADGVVAFPTSPRTLRWLSQHPQTGALLAVVAPRAATNAGRLEPVALALLSAARGPATLWWQGGELALACPASQGSRSGLATVAARHGLAFSGEKDIAVIGTSASLLGGPPLSPPPDTGGRIAALARVSDRWWRARVTASSLELTSGRNTDLPVMGPRTMVATRDITALLAAFDPALQLAPQPATLLVSAPHRWAAHFPGLVLPELVTRMLSGGRTGGTAAGAEPHRWNGVLGEVWAVDHGGLAIASDAEALTPELLDRPVGDDGVARIEDLTWVAEHLARATEKVPFFEVQAERLRRAVPRLQGLRAARWRIREEGARVRLEW